MALDGIVLHALANELDRSLKGGRIAKVNQPETDELSLTIKQPKEQLVLSLSASPSLPFVCLTEEKKANPATAPTFCMLLRKYIGGGKIKGVSQQGLERILQFEIEHLNEMGDVEVLTLTAELMGKYSNLILTKEQEGGPVILDSIRRVPATVSSLREVLPGRPYFLPESLMKTDPLAFVKSASFSETEAAKKLLTSGETIAKWLVNTFAGISYPVGRFIARSSGLGEEVSGNALSPEEAAHVIRQFSLLIETVEENRFSPVVFSRKGEETVSDFHVLPEIFAGEGDCAPYDTVSSMLLSFYDKRSKANTLKEKSQTLRKKIKTLTDKDERKLALMKKQWQDTESMDKDKLFGELLTAYAYRLPAGEPRVSVENYYDQTTVSIPMDKDLSVMENANRYYKRYNKARRTREALNGQMKEVEDELLHLGSLELSLSLMKTQEDLEAVRREMEEAGFVKKQTGKKAPKEKKTVTGVPLCFEAEGFLLYVGKNNFQNDFISFSLASPLDWWFHVKGVPGSHVIVKTEGRELPDHVYELAAQAAAYFSSVKDQVKVEVDYTLKKNLIKPKGGAPGFVIYHTNYSMMVRPGIGELVSVEG